MTLNELAALASAEKMIPNAPMKAHGSVEINAAVENAWQTLTTVSKWAQWYPYLKNAQLDGPFKLAPGLPMVVCSSTTSTSRRSKNGSS